MTGTYLLGTIRKEEIFSKEEHNVFYNQHLEIKLTGIQISSIVKNSPSQLKMTKLQLKVENDRVHEKFITVTQINSLNLHPSPTIIDLNYYQELQLDSVTFLSIAS